MNAILEEAESSQSIYFQWKFKRPFPGDVHLSLPMRFVREHGYKIDRWVILRTRTTSGTSSRPWVVQVKIYKNADGTRDVRFVDGWEAFATDNQLQEGDSLIFFLSREGARSEFEVYVFRKTGGSFALLDLCDSSSDDEDFILDSEHDTDSLTKNETVPSPSSSHHQDESMKIATENSSDDKASGSLQLTTQLSPHCESPSFQKRLTASSIQRSSGIPNSGQFEFPGKFVSSYGRYFRPNIQLQGVFEESPVYVVACHRSKGRDSKQNEIMRLGIKGLHWCTFVKENNLKLGEKLLFSLTEDSYFVVRKL